MEFARIFDTYCLRIELNFGNTNIVVVSLDPNRFDAKRKEQERSIFFHGETRQGNHSRDEKDYSNFHCSTRSRQTGFSIQTTVKSTMWNTLSIVSSLMRIVSLFQ